MQDDKLIITRQDGSQSIVENPFSAMQSTYDALAENPNAMPELSDESRARILAEIADEKNREAEKKHHDFTGMNRHERRKAAKLARTK